MYKCFSLKSICYEKNIFCVLVLVLILLLNACGFQWQKKETIPNELHNLYLQSANSYDQFTISLKRNLIANGINILPKTENKTYILEISSVNFYHTGANIYSSAQASVYNFTCSVNVKIYKVDGTLVLPLETISTSRNLTLNPNEVLVASNQVITVEQEMQNEVIRKILNRLRSKEIFDKITRVY